MTKASIQGYMMLIAISALIAPVAVDFVKGNVMNVADSAFEQALK